MADCDPVDTAPALSPPLHSWFHQDDLRANFASRLASQRSLPTDDTKSDIDLPMSFPPCSIQLSTVVHVHSEYDLESMATDSMPALTRGNSVASNWSVASTDRASIVDGGFVMQSVDGILTSSPRMRPRGDLLCPFQVLECNETCTEVVEFKMHVFSHFRGHPLPPFAPCFICGHNFPVEDGDDSSMAWNNMLAHMAYEHYRSQTGPETCVIKPDIALMRYLWNKEVITDAQFTRAQLEAPETSIRGAYHEEDSHGRIPEAPMPPLSTSMPTGVRRYAQSVGSSTEPYVVNAGRRQDRRQRDRIPAASLRARVRGNL